MGRQPDTVWILVGLVGLAWVALEIGTRIHKRRRAIAALRESWGQELRSNRTYRSPGLWYERVEQPDDPGLDDQTWNDLELDRVVTWVDRTLTALGAQILYGWLRRPLLTARQDHPRLALARAVADPEVRVPLQRELIRLGDREGWHVATALVDPGPPLWGPLWLYTVLGWSVLPALGVGALTGNVAVLGLGLMIGVTNPLLHYAASRRTAGFLHGLRAIRDGVATASRLRCVLSAELRARYPDLEDDLAIARKAVRFRGNNASLLPTGSMAGQAADLVADYHRAFLLTEVRAYLRSVQGVHRHRVQLRRVLSFIGEIDAALSVAYLLEHEPHLTAATDLDEPRALRATALRHPLLSEPVANDVGLGPGSLLVTGSNMAGKSTFLRTLGVNVVLAQTLGFADADAFAASPLRVFASMEVHDDLAASVSLYQAELQRILVLVREGAGDPPCLMLLDEVFRGTNPADRLAASGAVLLELCEKNLVVAATHDLELAAITTGRFDLGHFSERVEDDGVHFDYRLEPGLARSTNALALLGRLGYPERVVTRARDLADARR